MQPAYPTNNRSLFVRLALLFVVVILGILIIVIIRSLQFHLVSTTPGLNNVGVSTPYISFNYSAPLSTGAVAVTAAPNIIDSYKVSGKSIVVTLKAADLALNKKYTLTVGPVSSQSGKQIARHNYSFVVQNIPFQKMPASQQQAVLQQQATVPYSRTSITFDGTDALVGNGVSADQIQDMEQAFFLYSQSTKQHFSQVVIANNSVTPAPYDPNSASMTTSISFIVTVDGKPYNAKLEYTGLSEADLFLYDARTNAQVYDSGLLTPTAN